MWRCLKAPSRGYTPTKWVSKEHWGIDVRLALVRHVLLTMAVTRAHGVGVALALALGLGRLGTEVLG